MSFRATSSASASRRARAGSSPVDRQVERQRAVVDAGCLAGKLADGEHRPPVLALAAVVAGRASQAVDVGAPCHVLRGGDHGDRRVEVVHGGIPVLGRGGDPGEAPVSERRARVVAERLREGRACALPGRRSLPACHRAGSDTRPVRSPRVASSTAAVTADRDASTAAAGSPSTKARWLRRTRAAAESATSDSCWYAPRAASMSPSASAASPSVASAAGSLGASARTARAAVARVRRTGGARRAPRRDSSRPAGSRGWLPAPRRAPRPLRRSGSRRSSRGPGRSPMRPSACC